MPHTPLGSMPDISPGTTAERLAMRGPIAVAAREATLQMLSAEPFDVVIVGGGITGAGVAREAALAGLSTALIERADFASGTSSRSSRLIHGGVRYLEHGHIGLVFESSRERRLLLQLAPHLVRPLSFTWPVYKGARVPRWKLRAGLMLYDALALFRNVHAHEGLSVSGTLALEPALDPHGLVGGARYWDAATDDSRLTLANAIAAREAGAVVANHIAVTGPMRNAGGIALTGVTARDAISGAEIAVRASVVVNATGPWSDATVALTGMPLQHQVLGSAGAHIAVPRQRLGNNDAITLVSPVDGRVLFVLPAGVHSIIGTTERPARHGPDDIHASEQEVSYLLRTVNARFPFANLTPDDVISAWAGIRPLAAARAGSHSAHAASREHAVAQSPNGLLSVTGGKLTTYRAMAVDILAHVMRVLHGSGEATTATGRVVHLSATTPLPGGDVTSRESVVHEAGTTVHDSAVGERLALAYGSRWRNVWSYAQRDASLARRLVDDLPYLTAEVAHAVERELACTLSDVLIRRTHIAFETRDHGRGVAKRIAPLVGALLGWDDAQCAHQLAEYDQEVSRMFSIDMVGATSVATVLP